MYHNLIQQNFHLDDLLLNVERDDAFSWFRVSAVGHPPDVVDVPVEETSFLARAISPVELIAGTALGLNLIRVFC